MYRLLHLAKESRLSQFIIAGRSPITPAVDVSLGRGLGGGGGVNFFSRLLFFKKML